MPTQLQLPGMPFLYNGYMLTPCYSYPGIAVDVDGGVWTCRTYRAKRQHGWHKLKQHTSRGNRSRGYKRVSIMTPKGRRPVEVHILVADAYLGPRPYGYETDHKDEDNWNNQPDNLQYLTEQEHKTKTATAATITDEEWEDIL